VRVLSPASLDEALAMMAIGDKTVSPIAGGTDLLVSWHHHVKDDLHLLDMTRLAPELAAMRLTADRLELGAMTTYWDVIAHPEVSAAFPLLAEAARQVGAIQIQTRGTWAGNIANGSPAADGVPVMMSYDAEVELASKSGRRWVRLDEYFTGYKQSVRRPDELIVAIRIPRRPYSVEWFHKVGARKAQAITKVGVAVTHSHALMCHGSVSRACGWRVAANSVAPTVCRCRNLESALDNGQTFDNPNVIQQILTQDVKPIDDIRSTANYRLTVLSRLLYFHLAHSQFPKH
jgi:CO/xanthine dehydrogenase FAD-binding subunit